MMSQQWGPRHGDVVIRGALSDGLSGLDASGRLLAGGGLDLSAVLAIACMHARGDIWQQHIDERGRPIGEMFRLST
jgi:hypothetical protein